MYHPQISNYLKLPIIFFQERTSTKYEKEKEDSEKENITQNKQITS